MFRTIRSLVRGNGEVVVRECRRCGTTLEEGTESCPACGSSDVARFVL